MLDSYDGDIVEFFVKVNVRNPKLEPDGFISYEIAIETNHLSFSRDKSTVRRRYSDFASLHKLLSKEFPAMKTPRLPPKSVFQNHYHPSFIEKRRAGLEDFLNKIVSQKMYLSSKALHLFLQSSHSISEIKEIIQGRYVLPVESSDGLIKNGLSHFYSSCNSDENSIQSSSSPAELEVSTETFPNTINCDVMPNVSTKSNTHSPAGSKRVSFCEQVIVAQIHMD